MLLRHEAALNEWPWRLRLRHVLPNLDGSVMFASPNNYKIKMMMFDALEEQYLLRCDRPRRAPRAETDVDIGAPPIIDCHSCVVKLMKRTGRDETLQHPLYRAVRH